VLLLRLIVLTRLTESSFLLPSQGDMHFYNNWALRILHGQWTDRQAFYGLPLYAYLLAALYQVFGYSPFIPAFIQVCLEAGTAVLLYKLAGLIFGHGRHGRVIGFATGLGWGLFQPAAAYSVILMPVAWLVFVFWFIVWLIVKRQTSPKLHGWFLLGLLIGFVAMGIATVLFLVPLLFLALFIKWNPTRQWIAQVAAVAVFLLGIGLGTSPSWIHNYFVAHDPVLLSAHSGVNFWIGNNPWANGYPQFPPGLHAGQEVMLQDSITAAEKEAGRSLKRSEVSAYWSKKAYTYIRSHFGSWLKLLGTKAANFWNAFQYDDLSIITMLRENGVLFPGLRFGLVAALALPGLLLAWGKFPLSRWVAGAILLQMISLLSVFVTERYRLVAVPGLLLFASFGLWELWGAVVNRDHQRSAICVSLLALSTWFVSTPKKEASLWALDSYNSGLQALEAKHLSVAERKFNFAYAYVPDNAELNFALGNLRLAQGNQPEAKSYYLATLHLDPQHQGALNNLGVLALSEGQLNVAANFLARARDQDPRDAKVHYLLAQALLRAGNLRGARAEIARALELRPGQPEFATLRDAISKLTVPENH
jgi:Flp pilus assembly protein TadD